MHHIARFLPIHSPNKHWSTHHQKGNLYFQTECLSPFPIVWPGEREVCVPGVSEQAWSCLMTWLSSPCRLAPLQFFRATSMFSTSTKPSPSASNCPKAYRRREKKHRHFLWARWSTLIIYTKLFSNRTMSHTIVALRHGSITPGYEHSSARSVLGAVTQDKLNYILKFLKH